uniref:antigen peptide transporter 2-like n=1 Tax=Podarcis muralis TaxID=64176 RepID=UPI0010A07D64|nr:antigen peptide transporter 2-like [Podarcis muralis]
MMLPAPLKLAVPLILCDMVLLPSLDLQRSALASLGVPAAWLEAALHLLVLCGARGLLSLAWPSQVPLAGLAAVSLLQPLYLAVGRWFGDSPFLLSSAPRSWLLLGYGAVVLAHIIWDVLGQREEEDKENKGGEDKATLWKLVKLFRPDVSYIAGAFFFLTTAVLCETFIPYYTGRLIDILGKKYDSDAFSSAIFLMCLVSLGSSLSAGARGGLFTMSISRAIIRIRSRLFSSLVRQDLAFFQEVKTGDLTSRLSRDTTMMSRWVPLNANIFLRSLFKVCGLCAFMLGLSWRLTLLTLVEVPVMLAAQKVYDARYKVLLQAIQDSLARSGEVVRETVSSVETVRSFATEEEESERYDAALAETHRLKDRRDWERAVYLLLRRVSPWGRE